MLAPQSADRANVGAEFQRLWDRAAAGVWRISLDFAGGGGMAVSRIEGSNAAEFLRLVDLHIKDRAPGPTGLRRPVQETVTRLGSAIEDLRIRRGASGS